MSRLEDDRDRVDVRARERETMTEQVALLVVLYTCLLVIFLFLLE